MEPLRKKSLKLTKYLYDLLEALDRKDFSIITPKEEEQRGAQISLKLGHGLLDLVQAALVTRGVVIDERRPDVIRVAPAPLYNSFEDVFKFVKAFEEALETARVAKYAPAFSV